MKNIALASRYAKTLIIAAETAGKSEIILKQSTFLLSLYNENKNFASYLTNPVNKISGKISLITKVFKDFDQLFIHFLTLLCKKKRINILEEILIEFEKKFNQSRGIKKAVFTSVISLTEKENAHIKSILDEKYQVTFKIENKIDSSLIGGFTIKIDDTIIDHSMKNKLVNIEKNLLSVG